MSKRNKEELLTRSIVLDTEILLTLKNTTVLPSGKEEKCKTSPKVKMLNAAKPKLLEYVLPAHVEKQLLIESKETAVEKVPTKRGRKPSRRSEDSTTAAADSEIPKTGAAAPAGLKTSRKSLLMNGNLAGFPALSSQKAAGKRMFGSACSLEKEQTVIKTSGVITRPKVILPPCHVLLESDPKDDLEMLESIQNSLVKPQEHIIIPSNSMPDLIGANEIVEDDEILMPKHTLLQLEAGKTAAKMTMQTRAQKASPNDTNDGSPAASKGSKCKMQAITGSSFIGADGIANVSKNTRKRAQRTSSVSPPVLAPPLNTERSGTPPVPNIINLPLSVFQQTEASISSGITILANAAKMPAVTDPSAALLPAMTNGTKSNEVVPSTSPVLCIHTPQIVHGMRSEPVNDIVRAIPDSTQRSPTTVDHHRPPQPAAVYHSNGGRTDPPLPTTSKAAIDLDYKPSFSKKPAPSRNLFVPALCSSPPILPAGAGFVRHGMSHSSVAGKPKSAVKSPMRRKSAGQPEDVEEEGGRLLMRDWLEREAEKGEVYGGIEWHDREKGFIKIAWKHGSKSGWSEDDSRVFVNWAKYTGRYDRMDGQFKRWKANFRCAIHSLPDVKEIKEKLVARNGEQFKIYQLLPSAQRKRSRGSSDSASLGPSPKRRSRGSSSCKLEPDTSSSPSPPPQHQQHQQHRLVEDGLAVYALSSAIALANDRIETAPSPPAATVIVHSPASSIPLCQANASSSTGVVYLVDMETGVIMPTNSFHQNVMPFNFLQQLISAGLMSATNVTSSVPDHSYANAVVVSDPVAVIRPTVATARASPTGKEAASPKPSMPPPRRTCNTVIPTVVELLDCSSDEDGGEDVWQQVNRKETIVPVDFTTNAGFRQFSVPITVSTEAAGTVYQCLPVAAVKSLACQQSTTTGAYHRLENLHEMQPMQLVDASDSPVVESSRFPAVSVVSVDGAYDLDSPPRPASEDDTGPDIDLRLTYDLY